MLGRRLVPPLALAGLLLVTGLQGCAGTYPTPPPIPPLDGISLARFDHVAGGVYRSAQPTAHEFQLLEQRYGLRTVVKLNRGSDSLPDGVRLIHVPLDPLTEPSPETLNHIVDAIDSAEKPLLIHCTHGEDRTGLISAMYRIRHGASVETAYADMMRRGFHPYRGLWQAWLRVSGWGFSSARP